MSNQPQDSEQSPVEDNPETPETTNKTEEQQEQQTENKAENPETEALQKQLKEANEKYLRSEAEMQNLRRRVERDIENARKYALEKFVGDLLPVVDNLERALATLPEGEQQQAVKEGIELTWKSFLDVLGKFNVEAVNPEGEAFNPETHQAMSMVENSEVSPNTVIEVFQKGYTLNGRLVRPAMVVVSKASTQ